MHFTVGLLQLLYFLLVLLSKKANSLPHFWTLAGDHTTNLRPATGPAANSPHKYEQQTSPRGKLDQREPGCIPATGVQQADVSYFTITKLVRVILFQQQTTTLQWHRTCPEVWTIWDYLLLLFLRHFSQLNIMFVGGPNIRKDYHIEEGEEVRETFACIRSLCWTCQSIFNFTNVPVSVQGHVSFQGHSLLSLLTSTHLWTGAHLCMGTHLWTWACFFSRSNFSTAVRNKWMNVT